MPAVSVIMPAYNAAATLVDSITSALNQTLTDLEVIVVDDASTDNTLDVAASIQDSRVRVLASDRNLGPASARNLGLESATGHYIAFLDADDIWLPQKLAEQLHTLQNSENAKVVYSWFDLINENSQPISDGPRFTLAGNVYKSILLINFIGNGSNLLVEKAALDAVGYFDPEFKNAEDRDMWIRLAQHYQFAVCPQVHVLYRQASTSLSFDIKRQAKHSVDVINLAYKRAPEYLDSLRSKSLFNNYLYLSHIALRYPQNRGNAWYALNFWFKVICLQPRMLFQRITLKIIVKALISLTPFKGFFKHKIETILNRLDTSTVFQYLVLSEGA